MGPLVLYVTNALYSAYTNFSYTQTSTGKAQMHEIFTNECNMLTQGNGTLDAEWPNVWAVLRLTGAWPGWA